MVKEKGVIQTRVIHDHQILMVEGKIMYGNSQQIKHQLLAELKEARGYIFDLANLTQIDSTGFGVLVTIAKHLRKKQRRMAIILRDPIIEELFRIAKFNLLFPIVSSETEAIEALKGENLEMWTIEEY